MNEKQDKRRHSIDFLAQANVLTALDKIKHLYIFHNDLFLRVCRISINFILIKIHQESQLEQYNLHECVTLIF